VALQRTAAVLENRWSSFTLCHGAGGVASTLLEAARVLNDRRFLPKVVHVARAILDTHDRKGSFISGYSQLGRAEDPTLLMGTAGIGYFLLQLIADVPNILSLAIRRKGASKDRPLDERPLHEALARGLMPLTTETVRDGGGTEAARPFYADWHSREDILGFLREGAIRDGQMDTYERERAKLDLLDHCPSAALQTIAEWRQRTDGLRRSVGDSADNRFQLAPWARLLRGHGLLIRVKETRVSEIALTPLAERVFEAVEQPCDIESIIASLARELDAAAEDIREAVVHQLQSAIDAGLILVLNQQRSKVPTPKSK
jgi:hypothetical protein